MASARVAASPPAKRQQVAGFQQGQEAVQVGPHLVLGGSAQDGSPSRGSAPVLAAQALLEHFHPALGLGQLLLQGLAQGHALLELLQGLLQAQVPAFQLLHQGLQPVQAIVEGSGLRRHKIKVRSLRGTIPPQDAVTSDKGWMNHGASAGGG